jgi:DNA repair protein RadC
MARSAIPKRKLLIKDFPLVDRPREKLFIKNPKNLSEGELLAILLGTGTRGQNVLSLSEAILHRYPLRTLAQVDSNELTRIPGVGKSKVARIFAALELGERVYAPSSFTKIILRSTEDTLAHLRDIAAKKQEYLVVLYLNARHELLQREIVGMGSLNNVRITPKEIFSFALQTPCASIIVSHNHPSGDPTPSDDDIEFTMQIHKAGEVLCIPMIDHLIVSKNGYYSFRDNKMGK